MAIRASALANTYLLPQAAPQVAPKPQPFVDEIGAPEEGLAQMDGTTDAYFDKWAQLKSFAREAQETLGIDVRYPDPSIPESARLNRIYLKALADLKSQGAKLKTDQSMYNAALQRMDIIKKDPRKEHFSDFQPGVDVIHRPLDPIVTEVNNKLQQQYYDSKSLKEAEEIYEDTRAKLLQNAEQDAGNREYWLRQVDGLTPPTSAAKQFAPQRESQTNRGKVNAAGAFLKKVTNLMHGTADSYELSDEIFGPNGERVYVSEDTKGDTYGGNKILRYEYMPDTKETVLVTAGKDGAVTKIPLTGGDPMSLAKGYATENPRYSSAGEFMDQYADETGLFKDTGEVEASPLIASDADQRYQRMQKDIQKDQGTAFKVQNLKDKIAEMEPGIIWDDREEFKAKDGTPIKVISRKGGVYEISNIKDILGPEKYKKEGAAYKKMSKQKLMNFLTKRGVHLAGDESEEATTPVQATSGTTSAPKAKTVSRSTIASKVGTPGFEGYSEQELIDYYTSQGYTVK